MNAFNTQVPNVAGIPYFSYAGRSALTLLFAGTAKLAEQLGRGTKHQHRGAPKNWAGDHASCACNGRAPETYFFPPTPKADVFRLVVVLHDCLSGSYLLHRDGEFSEVAALRNPELPAVSRSADGLLRAMLQRDPNARPSVAEVTAQLAVLLSNDARSVVRALVDGLPLAQT